MASLRKRKGHWQVQVRRKGFEPLAKTFRNRQDALAWARQAEGEMDFNAFVPRRLAESAMVRDLIDRYLTEVAPRKRSYRTMRTVLITLRLNFQHQTLATLSPADVSRFRDQRLSDGRSGSTVIKELNLLSKVIDTAITDWGMVIPRNPVKLVSRPSRAPGRTRRLSTDEEEVLLAACDQSKARNLGAVVVLALETAMRLGEIISLEWGDIDLMRRTATLSVTKNGEARKVPLSRNAMEVLYRLKPSTQGRVFPRWRDSISFLHSWRRAVVRAELSDLRFHDLRHEAISRLFERGLNTMQVAAISGHKTLQMLKRYTHLRAEDLVDVLDSCCAPRIQQVRSAS